MSDFKENEMRDKLKNELMTSVRKNSQHSACIDAFEALLTEINDYSLVKTIIADMNKAIEEFMLIFKEIDKIDNNSINSRILTYEFIQPERFFKQSVKAVNQYIYLNAALNAKFFYNKEENGAKKWDIGNVNRLGNVWKEQYYKVNDPYVDIVLKKFNIDKDHCPVRYAYDCETSGLDTNTEVTMIEYQLSLDEYVKEMQEECRKVILIWNYCPAIFKAILQTKRRSLGLDTNSQKF